MWRAKYKGKMTCHPQAEAARMYGTELGRQSAHRQSKVKYEQKDYLNNTVKNRPGRYDSTIQIPLIASVEMER